MPGIGTRAEVLAYWVGKNLDDEWLEEILKT